MLVGPKRVKLSLSKVKAEWVFGLVNRVTVWVWAGLQPGPFLLRAAGLSLRQVVTSREPNCSLALSLFPSEVVVADPQTQ